ncbi:MaoC family dehydratase N-terminal domain-containing protein [Nocardia sp. 2]|uniref:MaoC family dehydratase N-terminal domain-containing protein n=1 Tax=Nocardia acididurans TaxID=2802282 RepID=A0ABS1M2G2_9NOCA|nr:MaoC family dehydratase N-terminal domain-containing protein [Nocardia acididurans]MBL1074711.1 MaoC family dehydratase N-terminal domain-containing protein [Nocardia acididurans]
MSNTVLSAGAEQARALVGRSYRCARPFVVERSRIREFARVVQAYHPAHWEESAAARLGFETIMAPPTFAALVWQQVRREILDTVLTGYRLDRIVHVDQTLDVGRPLLAGDVLTCDVHFESFRHFHAFDVLTITGVLRDRHGTPIQSASTALLAHTGEPGATSARDSGLGAVHAPDADPPLADTLHSAALLRDRLPRTRVDFDRLAADTELPTLGVSIQARDLANYARVVGDPPAAGPDRGAAGGRPALIAPGMLVLGLAAGYVTSWTSDPAAVTKYRAEFANQVHYLAVPRADTADIEFKGRVIACDRRRRTATVTIDARSQGRKLFGYASAEVRFAPSLPR